MRKLTLTEHSVEPRVALSEDECDALRGLNADLGIYPSLGLPGHYDVTASSWIGAIELPNLSVQIRPKIPISRVLFLISYAMQPKDWYEIEFAFGEEDSLLEAVIPGFVFQIKRAFRNGMLKSYRLEESALPTVRGRFRFQEQLKRRFGVAPPIELAYDEFTDDIEENRLLKAALDGLEKIRIRSNEMLYRLRHFLYLLNSLTTVQYDRRSLPAVHFTRLNHHYRPAVELAKLILRSLTFDLTFGNVRASAFLVNMNEVFERFVCVALREALRLSDLEFPAGGGGHSIFLDIGKQISLRPDLSWWEGSKCVFVGDVKYKKISVSGIKHPDLYQLLAYTIATGLPGGLLCYAAGEGEPAIHEVVDLGKKLQVSSIDLSGGPEEILTNIVEIGHVIQGLRTAGALAKAS